MSVGSFLALFIAAWLILAMFISEIPWFFIRRTISIPAAVGLFAIRKNAIISLMTGDEKMLDSPMKLVGRPCAFSDLANFFPSDFRRDSMTKSLQVRGLSVPSLRLIFFPSISFMVLTTNSTSADSFAHWATVTLLPSSYSDLSFFCCLSGRPSSSWLARLTMFCGLR